MERRIARLRASGVCSQAMQKMAASETAVDTACALDGMVLKDLLKDCAGPKERIHDAEGKPDFFCD